jgi:hypothetical protein
MSGIGFQTMAFEEGTNVSGRSIVVARKFDVRITECGNFCESSLEVLSQLSTHRIELQADFLQPL